MEMDSALVNKIMTELIKAESFDDVAFKLMDGAYEYDKEMGKIDTDGPLAQLLATINEQFPEIGSEIDLSYAQTFIRSLTDDRENLFDSETRSFIEQIAGEIF
jgi:hypothetical protein